VAVAAAAVGVRLGVVAVKGCERSFEGGGRGHFVFVPLLRKPALCIGAPWSDPSFFSTIVINDALTLAAIIGYNAA